MDLPLPFRRAAQHGTVVLAVVLNALIIVMSILLATRTMTIIVSDQRTLSTLPALGAIIGGFVAFVNAKAINDFAASYCRQRMLGDGITFVKWRQAYSLGLSSFFRIEMPDSHPCILMA